MDWPAALAMAEQALVQHYLLEMEVEPLMGAFEAIEASLEWLEDAGFLGA